MYEVDFVKETANYKVQRGSHNSKLYIQELWFLLSAGHRKLRYIELIILLTYYVVLSNYFAV